MAITSYAAYLAAPKQYIEFSKSNVGFNNYCKVGQFNQGQMPPAGTLAGVNTANGVVPDDTVTGYPSINTLGSGNTGYLTRVELMEGSTVGPDMNNIEIFDRLFVAGAYTFGSSTTLASQPDFSARVPDGDYKGLELWCEVASNFTGSPVFTIGYTNENGVSGRSTTYSVLTNYSNQSTTFQIPLQAGDQGIQSLDSFSESGATGGTFNIMILRPLVSFSWNYATTMMSPIIKDFMQTGLPVVYDSSAIYTLGGNPGNNGGGVGLLWIKLEVSEG
jgi:hypothetical protein